VAKADAIIAHHAIISEKVPQNPFSGTVGWESKRFAYGAIVAFRTEDAAKAGLDNCHFEVSRMNICSIPQ
jgi:hypothetical protein